MKLIKSFQYAVLGLIYCIKTERNFRVHLIITLYVLFFSLFYHFNATHYTAVIGICMLILFAEIINTAIERLTSFLCPEFNEKIKIIKDLSAASVLILSIFAVIVAFVLFWDLNVVQSILSFFADHIVFLIPLILSGVLSLLFIFKVKEKNL